MPRLDRSVFLLVGLSSWLATPAYAQTPDGDERPSEEVSADDSVDDSAEDEPAPSPEALLAARIRAAYEVVGGLEAVEVLVRDGVVRLDGVVSSNATRDAAERIAERAGTSLYLVNRVEVRVSEAAETEDDADDPDHALEGRIRSVFAEVAELRGLEVRVRSGIVRLRGRVPSEDAIERARDFASRTPGVLYVDARVEVDQDLDVRVNATMRRLEDRGRALLARGPLYLVALVVLLFGWTLSRLVRRPSQERRMRRAPLLRHLARQVVATVIVLGSVMLALDLLGATGVLGAILGTAGVMGLALGFAFKDIIENYLASVLLAVRHPFAPDESVKVGPHEGKVVRLTGRDTVLMTADGNHLRIPNAEVFKSAIVNFTRNPLRRFDFVVVVPQRHELGRVQREMLGALQMEGVLRDPAPQMRVERVAPELTELRVVGWVDQRSFDFAKVRSEAMRRARVVLDGLDAPERAPSLVPEALDEPLHDVAPDEALTAQVEEERRRSDERDLLAGERADTQ